MTLGQRFARVVTTTVVRVPLLWRLFRRSMVRSFDRLAPTWEERMTEEGLRPMRAALETVPGRPRAVLDLGTGTGRVARLASSLWPGAEVVGVDVSPAMVEQARSLSAGERYEVADSTRLPFPDGAFDLVTLNNMIPFFDEVARVTAPGGHVAIAFSMGDRTPIYVPFDRVRAELERRGFSHRADFAAGQGRSLLAVRADRS